MVEGKEWKTVFQICYGLSESLVIPFGLTNAPANFQHFINNMLYLYVDIFIIANIENILINSNNIKDYQSDIDKVLEAISNASLYLKLEMYRFYYQEVEYLGFIISSSSTKRYLAKVATM
jgi:hypothetical protein